MGKPKLQIEDDAKKLLKLDRLLAQYWTYISKREGQPLAAEVIALVGTWIKGNLEELGGDPRND